MGTLAITQTIAGTLDEPLSKTFKTSIPCSHGADFTHDIGPSWVSVASTAGYAPYQTVVVANTGSVSALYRVFDGTNYARGTLPAGRAVVIHLSHNLAHGAPTTNTTKVLSVWSASSTTVRVITIY